MLTTQLIVVGTLALIALAAKDVGRTAQRIGLPLISGFLLAGVAAGPHGLGIFDRETLHHLQFVDAIALAFIALAAGAELDLRELRHNLRSIIAIITGQTFVTFALVTVTLFSLSGRLEFTHGLGRAELIAVAALAAVIMIARSPSSAYAIIRELRAKGPFTTTALGATVLIDGVVIVLFAFASSLASAATHGEALRFGALLLVAFEVILDIVLGLVVAQVLRLVLAFRLGQTAKAVLVVATGATVFALSSRLSGVHWGGLPFSFFTEPLLICMTAGFAVTNMTPYRDEFQHIVEETAPIVFVVFFTLVGATLELTVLRASWLVVGALAVVRFAAIMIGSFVGGAAAGDPMRHNCLMGLAFVTQAGVSVGLAKEVAVEHAEWGAPFATLCIGVIVFNQVVGPPLMKFALRAAGEAHQRHATPEFDGVRDAIIFGVDSHARALARVLNSHGWLVRLVDFGEPARADVSPGVEVHRVAAIDPESLRPVEGEHAEAVVAMMADDDDNFRACELAYEQWGCRNLVARLHDAGQEARFRSLGALTVHPGTALPRLFDHCVRSPAAAALVLGQEEGQDVIDVEVTDPRHAGQPLRALRLPEDALIVSVRRKGQWIISHGYTVLEIGDLVTVVGAPESLEEVALLFEASPLKLGDGGRAT